MKSHPTDLDYERLTPRSRARMVQARQQFRYHSVFAKKKPFTGAYYWTPNRDEDWELRVFPNCFYDEEAGHVEIWPDVVHIEIASMAQNCAMFHEPINDFIQAMNDGRLRHDGNPMLRWCIGNVVLVRDRQDRWMFTKRDSADKIDPVVAVVMAYRRAMIAPERISGSLYL